MEFRTLGFNAQTVGFLGTLFFTIAAFAALRAQCRTILVRRSGESLATSYYIYALFVYVVTFRYGVDERRLALIFNGAVLAAIHLAIVVSVWRFKPYTMLERTTLAGALVGIGVMFVARDPGTRSAMFGLALIGGILWGLMIPRELWRAKSPGVLRIEPTLVGLVSVSFWTVYGYTTGNRVLMVTCPLLLSSIMLTIALWLRYGGDLRTAFRRQST